MANKEKILIIDDTEANRYSVSRILSHGGYEVEACNNIADGSKTLKSFKPGLLILDVKLPDGNGFALCAKLKTNPETAGLPILMTSASFVEGRDRAFGLESGADGYLTTPYDPLELLATVRSLLRTRAAEEKLRRSEERFEIAMQGMNDGLWDWDMVSGEVYYAPRYMAQLGLGRMEGSVAAWLALMHPEDVDSAQEVLEQYIAGTSAEYKNIFRMRHAGGEYRWILSRAMAVRDAAGKPYRMVGAHTDITEQKELERELREISEKADLANRAKTEFLANMSHEIRTPMNAIIGLTHVLSMSQLTDKQRQFVSTLKLSADSMMTLINDMLDIAKIEDNMIQLESVPFSLRELMQQVISMMAVKANQKNIELTVTYSDAVGESFLGDPVRIQQIVMNLASNAIKFTHHGGVQIGIDYRDGALAIEVRDTGIGIPDDMLPSIFEKFTQADSSITRKYGGTGLGLAISSALAACMGGSIAVSSVLNEGSVFTVQLPLGSVTGAPSAPLHASGAERAADSARLNKHVLLVEDYKANIMVATAILDELGYSYDVATSGIEALQKLTERAFDAVLMDVQMHGMDGYEATRRLRQWETEGNRKPLPVIAMTAHALMGDREKCLAAGMNDYISKPFNPAELGYKLTSHTA